MDVVTGEFKELQSCSAMSLSKSGSLAFIGGRRAYGLVDLDRPQEILKLVSRLSKYDVSEVQFSREKETLLAVASNAKIELLDFKEGGELVCESVLKGHTRGVTDVSWHGQQTNLLASGSFDNFINVWDIREPRTPTYSLPAVTGCTQVCWERTCGKYLASAHEGEIKLWDFRNGTTPVLYLNAHRAKIFSMDFCPHKPDQLVSSSADNTVKLWNISQPRAAENTIKLSKAPVWKVRYTPFGEGLVTLVLNTAVRRDNNLMLWNTHNLMSPVHTFYGHTDMVLEFGWRNLDSSANRFDYQLVTWARDSTIKLWPISASLKAIWREEESNIVVQKPARSNSEETSLELDEGGSQSSLQRPTSNNSSEGEDSGFASARKDLMTSSYDSNFGAANLDEEENAAGTSSENFSAPESAAAFNSQMTPASKQTNQTTNLKQEFKLLNFGERLTLEEVDFVERYCVVVAETAKHTILLTVKFPENYPFKQSPVFSFMTGTTLDQTRGYHLLRKLRLTAQKQVNKNRRCLEMCLRQFEQDIEAMHLEEQDELASAEFVAPSYGISGFMDSNVPFPRTSGARFCGPGQLVCFGWSYTMKYASMTHHVSMKTPRAFSAVSSGQLGIPSPPQYIPLKQRGARVRFGRNKSRISSAGSSNTESGIGRSISEGDAEFPGGTITIYDVLPLWPFSKELAQKYIVMGDDVESTCRFNASAALASGQEEIARAWALAAASCAFAEAGKETANLFSNFPAIENFPEDLEPWSVHPLGRPLLMSLVNHFSSADIQTAAMLCSVFCYKGRLGTPSQKSMVESSSAEMRQQLSDGFKRKKSSKSECSAADDHDYELAQVLAKHSSESHSLEDISTFSRSESKKSLSATSSDICTIDCRKFLLDPYQIDIYDGFMRNYSEILSRLGLLIKSAEVNKCLSPRARINEMETNTLDTMVVGRQCSDCGRPLSSKKERPSTSYCRHCRKRPLCSLCNLPIEGLTSICLHCGHGGHTEHTRTWFETHTECPTGCGCACTNFL